MTLASGEYLAKKQRVVVVWPSADADGDGAEVWKDRFDSEGRQIGRDKAKDAQGRPIREYLPPEGFENRPSYTHEDNYVKVDSRGQVVRQPNGEAICLKPGQAVVYNPDGSVEYLVDEYSQHLFGLAHDSTSPQVEETEEERTARLDAARAARVAELERQLEEARSS